MHFTHLSNISICIIYCARTYQNVGADLCQNSSSNRLCMMAHSPSQTIHQRFVSGRTGVVCKCGHFNSHAYKYVCVTKSVLCSFFVLCLFKWTVQQVAADCSRISCLSHLCCQLSHLHSNLLAALNCNLLRLQLLKRAKDNCLRKRIYCKHRLPFPPFLVQRWTNQSCQLRNLFKQH